MSQAENGQSEYFEEEPIPGDLRLWLDHNRQLEENMQNEAWVTDTLNQSGWNSLKELLLARSGLLPWPTTDLEIGPKLGRAEPYGLWTLYRQTIKSLIANWEERGLI